MSPASTSPSALADHLIPFPDLEWAAWRHIGLRGAGFPAEMALRLAHPACAEAADRVLEAEAEARAFREGLIQQLNGALDRLSAEGAWDDESRRKPLLKAIRKLGKGKMPADAEELLGSEALLQARDLEHRLETSRARYLETYETALEQQSEAIFAVASDPRFQEAVLWQNRGAFHSAVAKIVETPPDVAGRDSQRRQHEELVASYLQRYALKNDTIGFFGPICIVRFDDGDGNVSVRPGERLLAERGVYLEAWCVFELAAALASREEVKPWLRPRRMPFVEVEGRTLKIPFSPPSEIPAPAAAVLQLCDGHRTATELAAESGLGETAFAVLGRLAEKGLVDWNFDVPVSPFALDLLRRQIEDIADPGVRTSCLEAVSELEAARRALADAAGQVASLDRAFEQLDETFTRITGRDATRREGKSYAARTLAYEDCRRDLEMRIGRELREQIGSPLTLVMGSGRWFEHAAGEVFRQVAREIYQRLCEKFQSPVVEAAYLWDLIEKPLFEPDHNPLRETALPELQRRWRQIVGLDPEAPPEGPIELSSQELESRFEEAFAAPYPGWQLSRYFNPDVMVAAESVEAVENGDYQLVLGELHAGLNTLNIWAIMVQNPHRDEILRSLDVDLPEPRLVVVMGKDSPSQTTRTQVAYRSPKDYLVPPSDHAVVIPEDQRLPITDLVVAETPEGGLELRTRDGAVRFDVIEALGQFISHRVLRDFDMFGDAPHLPRVVIDRMVVQRESWRLRVAELEFAREKEPAARMLVARRWARGLRLPRFVFVNAPVEPKPFYVDFDSPIYVDILAKVVRRQERQDADAVIRVTEMLPRPDQAWLPDAEGNRYTSELRIVVTDRGTL